MPLQAAPLGLPPHPALPALTPGLLSAARREKEDEQGQGHPVCHTPHPGRQQPGSETDNRDPPRDVGMQPPSVGPSEAPSPRGSWEAAFTPLRLSLPAPAAPVSEWAAAQRGSGTKGPLSPPRSGGAGSGGRGSLRSPQRRGGSGRPAPGRPAAGHPVKVRLAAGPQGTWRDRSSPGSFPQPPANNLPGPRTRRPSRGPAAAPRLPGGSLLSASEPNRAEPSRLPIPFCPQTEPGRAPPSPPAPFP